MNPEPARRRTRGRALPSCSLSGAPGAGARRAFPGKWRPLRSSLGQSRVPSLRGKKILIIREEGMQGEWLRRRRGLRRAAVAVRIARGARQAGTCPASQSSQPSVGAPYLQHRPPPKWLPWVSFPAFPSGGALRSCPLCSLQQWPKGFESTKGQRRLPQECPVSEMGHRGLDFGPATPGVYWQPLIKRARRNGLRNQSAGRRVLEGVQRKPRPRRPHGKGGSCVPTALGRWGGGVPSVQPASSLGN